MSRRCLVFVLCPGHSGSTLLGHFLGAHSLALHLGEIVAPLRRGRPFVCRVCEDERCPVWGTLLRESFVRDVVRTWRRERHLPGLGAALAPLREDPRGAVQRRVLDGLPELRVLVDSSKSLSWARWNGGGARDLRVVFLQLRRDLRAVLASHLRRPQPEPAERIARALVRESQRIERALDRRDPGDVYRLHYEDLVEAPAATGEALCRFLGLAFEPDMLEYFRVPQHVIGGNAGPTYQVRRALGRTAAELEFLDQTSEENQRFYREGQPGFIRDERWRQQLDPATLERFEAIAGAANRRLGYPRAADAEVAEGGSRRNSRST